MENTKRKNQRGAMMVFFAILLPFLFGLMGLAIDASVLYLQKGKLQDVADAAALAGAAHLGDEERQKGVEKAVLAYVNGNGIKVSKYRYFTNGEANASADVKPEQRGMSTVNWGIVQVDDVDRVRVRITQRVPVYFVSVLLEDYRDGVNVTSVAAATGEVGVQPQSQGGAMIIGMQDIQFHSSDIRTRNGKFFDNDIYAPGMQLNKQLMITGDVYSWQKNDNIHLKESGKFMSLTKGDYEWEGMTEIERKEYEQVKKMKEETKRIYDESKAFLDAQINNKSSYKSGEGNKVYIDKDGIHPSSSINSSKAYDVYLAADGINVLDYAYANITNDYLYGITKINNLIIDGIEHMPILNTHGIDYCNVYITGEKDAKGAFIEGYSNNFRGKIFSPHVVNIMGEVPKGDIAENCYGQLIANTVNVGYGYHFGKNNKGGYVGPADSSWSGEFFLLKDIIGDSGSGSGGVTSKLRLVE